MVDIPDQTRLPGFKNLVVWQKSIDLVEGVYRVTRSWPKDEVYGLTSQVRRAAISIPSNIAEGRGRASAKEYLHHLSIAHGSLCEVETQLVIAGDSDISPSKSSKSSLSRHQKLVGCSMDS